MDIGNNITAIHRPNWFINDNIMNSTSIESSMVEQEDEDHSMEDSCSSTSRSVDDAFRKFDAETFFPPKNTPRWRYANSRQSSLTDDSSDSDMSHLSAFTRKYPRMSDSFRQMIGKKNPYTTSSPRRLQTARTNRGRKSTSVARERRNPLSSQEVNRFEDLKICRSKFEMQKLDHGIAPSLENLTQDQDISFGDTTLREEGEMKNFCSEENLKEKPPKEAIKRAKERLSMALKQPNGRIFIKICIECEYVTLAKGLSVYNHKEKYHPSSRKPVEQLFRTEELKEEEAVEKMARCIMRFIPSQDGVKQVDIPNE